jgi:hypothetical protein
MATKKTRRPKRAAKAKAPVKAKAPAKKKAAGKKKVTGRKKATAGIKATAKKIVEAKIQAVAGTKPAARGRAKAPAASLPAELRSRRGRSDEEKAPARSFVKVFLHDRGLDLESAWCEPAGSDGGLALFRLVNVPFLHAKPTFGDVIAARRDGEYANHWTWNRDGVDFARIGERLHEDGGRYALVVDYEMSATADFDVLSRALRSDHDIVPEGCFGPRGRRPGRLYLAAPRDRDPAAVMAALAGAGEGFRFTLVHPT